MVQYSAASYAGSPGNLIGSRPTKISTPRRALHLTGVNRSAADGRIEFGRIWQFQSFNRTVCTLGGTPDVIDPHGLVGRDPTVSRVETIGNDS